MKRGEARRVKALIKRTFLSPAGGAQRLGTADVMEKQYESAFCNKPQLFKSVKVAQ
jgi:hypothetical protein